ncbi:MAG: NPCBM/NEW2 domain-containing protein [Mycobacterium sp.]|nr:NPCBM/NEW2 domain-containing protein [Mycobacterium sp.]
MLYRVAASHDWANYPPATSLALASSSVPFTINGSEVVTHAQASGTSAFTYTLANSGKVPLENVQLTAAAPASWTVTPTSPNSKGSLASNGTFSTSWSLQVPPDTSPDTYPLAVHASYTYAEGTRSGTASSTGIMPVVLPAPSGTTPLSDVAWVSESNGCGPLLKDQSNGGCTGAGQPLTIRGDVYPKGLGAHAPSDIVYYLGRNCSSLTTDVGIDDEVGGQGEVTFQIFADDAKVADSGAVTGTSPVVTLSADLTGATWLLLHIDPDGANFFDHSDWAGPELTCT